MNQISRDNRFPILGRDPDGGAIGQMHTCLVDGRAAKGALMADHHLGYSMPVGGVIAYRNSVSPSGVGYDIGCGNMAVRVDMPADELRANIVTIMDDIFSQLSFGMGRRNKETPQTAMALELYKKRFHNLIGVLFFLFCFASSSFAARSPAYVAPYV